MSENTEKNFTNLAKKISDKNISWLSATKEYIASLLGVQTLSPTIKKALQDTHNKAEEILAEIKK